MINVMIVDDSAVVRQTLSEIFSQEPDITVLDTAFDPIVASQKLQKKKPDVMILDIEMPRMDGLTFLKDLMFAHPLPVIICSSKAEEGSRNFIQALSLGAVDIVPKPQCGTKQFLEESRILFSDAVRAAYAAHLDIRRPFLKKSSKIIPPKSFNMDTTNKVIVVGASTGGTKALEVFLEALPQNTPGIVIVQHMPEHFTRSFAKRLDGLCLLNVKEAENNDSVIPGRALIAPGNRHVVLKRSGARYYVEVKDGPLVSRHRPSVDVLFRSTARYAGQNAIGILMTGMGSDGAKGLLEIKTAGGKTVAQDEESCVVFGMPKEAVNLGAAEHILPLEDIAAYLISKEGVTGNQ